MRTDTVAVRAESAARWFYAGGVSAIALAASYVVMIVLYARVGAPPREAEAWLTYLQGKTTLWWGILGLSVLTDLLFIPVTLALALVLEPVGRHAMRLASAFVALFVVLDLAVTWPAYASLIVLGQHFEASTDRAARLGWVVAAGYPASVLASPLELVYAMGVLSLAILIIGLVMRRGPFGAGVAWLAVATGALGITSCVGSAAAIIATSLLTTVWLFWVGARLCGLSNSAAVKHRPPV